VTRLGEVLVTCAVCGQDRLSTEGAERDIWFLGPHGRNHLGSSYFAEEHWNVRAGGVTAKKARGVFLDYRRRAVLQDNSYKTLRPLPVLAGGSTIASVAAAADGTEGEIELRATIGSADGIEVRPTLALEVDGTEVARQVYAPIRGSRQLVLRTPGVPQGAELVAVVSAGPGDWWLDAAQLCGRGDEFVYATKGNVPFSTHRPKRARAWVCDICADEEVLDATNRP
jgi:hypothetical protein